MFTNGQNIGLPLRDRVQKAVYGMDIYWISANEKVSGAAVSKGGEVDSLLNCSKRTVF